MKVKDSINPAIVSAAVAMLQASIPELTPTRLIVALQSYDSENKEQADHNVRPRQPYTIKEVATLLQISKPTIYRMARRHEISLIKIGSSTRIAAEEVDKLLSPDN